jgi:hypothetical protein
MQQPHRTAEASSVLYATRRQFLHRSLLASLGAAGVAGLASMSPIVAWAQDDGDDDELTAEASDIEREPLDFATREAYDRADLNFNDGNGAKTQTDESGALSWQQSYLMHSYVLMYRAHRDLYYLDKLIDHADHVLASRDSVRGLREFRGLSLPAWQRMRPERGDTAPFIQIVGTGMIIYPLALFARTVRAIPELRDDARYAAKANEYIQAVKDAVAVHDEEWRDIGDDMGTYVVPRGWPFGVDGVELQFNMHHALGRCIIQLAAMIDEPIYRERAERMARLFKSDLRLDDGGAYVWNYHWTKGRAYRGWTAEDQVSINRPEFGGNRRPEDIGHGAISIDFAEQAFRHGIVFDEQDMQRFARTYVQNLLTTTDEEQNGGRVTVWRMVDSSRWKGEPRDEIFSAFWQPLAPWDRRIFDSSREMYAHHYQAHGFRRGSGMIFGSAWLNWFNQQAPTDPDVSIAPVAHTPYVPDE